MKKIIVVGVVMSGGLLFWYLGHEPLYRGTMTVPAEPLVFAHRGFGSEAPDNSVAGAKKAIALGLDGVDVDAQLTTDGEVVIFHDVTVDRFTEGTGRVDAHTYNELLQYDLGSSYSDGTQYQNERIATFADFVDTVTPHAYLMTELKVATARNTGIEQKVVAAIAARNAFDRVFISSFNPVVLYRLEQIDSRIQTVFIFQDSGWDEARVAATAESDRVALPWYLQSEWTRRVIRKVVNPDALSVNENVNPKTIDKLLAARWPLFIWSLNTAEAIQSGVTKRPFGIITDEPTMASSTVSAMREND
jgi:glycerophosphoryl diester phosphodiesterase